MANFFKKKGGGGGQATGTSGIQMTESEAALAQSDFNTDKITEIQNKFTRSTALLYPGRIFIREGLLWKVCRKGPKKRQFFLFNDILVYGSVVANLYSNQHILPLSQMSISAECFYQPRVDADFDEESEQMELDVANAFQICHADKSFHVFALSAADKSNWLANLHKHINRVSQSLSSDQQLLTKPVWVPDSSCKECMVCTGKFTAFVRKHHCRQCGRIICSSCSPYRVPSETFTGAIISDSKKMERVCKDCFKDRSSVSTRHGSGGGRPPCRPPPPSVAAKVVSTVIESAKPAPAPDKPSPPSTVAQQDSSTDTEDSDDSDNEPETEPNEVISGASELIVQPSLVETQPTPPPRKKRLKKKLEQVLAKELGNVNVDVQDLSSEESKEGEDTLKEHQEEGEGQIKEHQEDVKLLSDMAEEDLISCHLDSISSREGVPVGATSPKKSRRRKKHTGFSDYGTPGQTQNEVDDNDPGKEIDDTSHPSDSNNSVAGRNGSDGTAANTIAQNALEHTSQARPPGDCPKSDNSSPKLQVNQASPPDDCSPKPDDSIQKLQVEHLQSDDVGDDRKKRNRKNKFK